MQRQTYSLVSLLVVFLTACGGGSGSGPTVTTNTAPTISGAASTSVRVGDQYTFTPTASDADGDSLTFEIENVPFWADFNSATGELSGVPLSSGLGAFADIVIRVSDGQASAALPAFSLDVLQQLLDRSNFITEGQVFVTDNGYQSVGTLVLDTGERTQRFEDADLVLEFDENDKLIDISGETLLPANPSDNVSIDSPVRAVVGMMTGAEIFADPDIDILLQAETNYFVFFIGVAVDITIGDRNNPGVTESITLETPLAGQILLITDPTDPFLYRYGSQPLLGEYGTGESVNGLIPFQPQLDFPQLDSFSGHQIEKGSFGIGVKIFDFFELSGTRVTKNPQFADINWTDPFESEIEFRAGANGNADFAFAVLSVGLFSFELAKASATFDVGFDRQSMAMQMQIAPDVSWVPDWFPFVPSTQVNGEWFVNGRGEFSAELSGSYTSLVPPADLVGSMAVNNDGAILSGTTTDDTGELTASIEFADNATTGRIEFPVDVTAGFTADVSAALDRELDRLEQALADLENAVADYEFEVSLRGLRSSLPVITDTAISVLNGVPGRVRTAVDNATVSYINNTCAGSGIFRVCLSSLVNENSIGNATGESARSQAASAISPYVAAMQELKRQAESGDDESLREALRTALLAVYDRRVFSRRFTISYSFPSPFGSATVYNRAYEETILPAGTASDILTAANNVFRITETSNIVISAQQVFDALPTEEVISRVKQEVDDGIASVPSIDGAGFTVSGSDYSAFITLAGNDQPVLFNVLSPGEAIAGAADLAAGALLDGE